jgi:outer membrane protein OmpA-like peptidoglycan-associated protein
MVNALVCGNQDPSEDKMSFRALVLGTALSALAIGSAHAQVGSNEPYTGPNGPYLRAEGGLSFLNDMKGSGSGNNNTTLNFGSKESQGFIGGGAAGWKLGQLRLELGLDFSGFDVSSINVNNDGGLGARLGGPSLTGASRNSSGSVNIVSGMVNALWDFRTGTPFVPYVGVGVGMASASLDSFSVNGRSLSNSSDVVFAYQPMVGLRYHITDAMAVGLEYRYFATVQPTFKDSSGASFKGRIENHNVLANFSYFFGGSPTRTPEPVAQINPAAGPAPQLPPAMAPQPTPEAPAALVPTRQSFIVYFDFNKATLTPQGMRIADTAADAFKQSKATHIEIAGFTDASGGSGYDEALSRRRAETVRDYLIRRGVPLNDMEVGWHGKASPRAQTQDGAREAQNRRVEIIIP